MVDRGYLRRLASLLRPTPGLRVSPVLPLTYRILPESIRFTIRGFSRSFGPDSKTLALRQRDCAAWADEFVDRLVGACGRAYLPVCRMSDGDYLFALGEQPPDERLPLLERLRARALRVGGSIYRVGGIRAGVAGLYHSGDYSWLERLRAARFYAEGIRCVSERGILALHLSYGPVPFQERYFPALGRWLARHRIVLTDQNYVPFYFVYAALSGPRRGEILGGRRVLVVTGAKADKRRRIEESLRREGVADVAWLPISASRSLFDRIDVSPFVGKVDLAVVAAGIGKPQVLAQLEPLGVPCIDVGYMLEVWADPANRWKRVVCAPDEEWERAGRTPDEI